MPLTTFTPPVPPSPGTQTSFNPKLKKADFGDGYSQVTRDGLNFIKRQVPLNWDTLTVAQAQALENFFVTMGGDTPFLYQLSDDPAVRQWRCEQWQRTRDAPNTFMATLIEDFSIVS